MFSNHTIVFKYLNLSRHFTESFGISGTSTTSTREFFTSNNAGYPRSI